MANEPEMPPVESQESLVVYKLTVDVPGSPEGEVFQIPGLGEFENGASYEISNEEAANYQLYHSTMVLDKKGNFISKLGPTLKSAAKSMHGVTVTSVSDGGN